MVEARESKKLDMLDQLNAQIEESNHDQQLNATLWN